MEKTDSPESFGIFKPVGHTVITFGSASALQLAVSSLLGQGFASTALLRYTPEAMKAQVDAEMKSPSPLASFGHELKFIESHRTQAERGCSFLVVHAPDDEQAARVDVLVRQAKAVSAQRYGTFVIEELAVQPLGDEVPVYESPPAQPAVHAAG